MARWIMGGLGLLLAQGALSQPTAMPQGDVVQFLDGSSLHGRLQELDAAKGLSWEHPEAKGKIDFNSAHIDRIHFAQAGSITVTPACHFRFANGDDLYGSLTSLNQEQVGISTWFGGEMKIPRASVQGITFLSKAYKLLYEGPADASGWAISRTSPVFWAYRDGTFIGTGPGTLGRDMQLSGSIHVEFDLNWTDSFDLLINLYGSSVEHLDYNVQSYFLNLTHEQVSLQRIQHGATPANLGTVALPAVGEKGKMHVTIFCNKEDGTVAVFINDRLIKRWRDNNGLADGGKTMVFYLQRPSPAVTLGNLVVSEWDSKYEPVGGNTSRTNGDAVCFINRDRAGGHVGTLQDGKLGFVFGAKQLNVPLERITQIDFTATNAAAIVHHAGEVRASFPGGGSLSFQLAKWDDRQITGQSEIFGPLTFQPRSIRELQFNLDRPKISAAKVEQNEFEGLDE